MFGLGMGNFWNPESGFPCAGQGREIVWGTRPRKGLSGVPGLRAGFGLGHSSRTPHSGQYALLCLRVGSTTQPGRGRPTPDREGSPRPSRVKLKTKSHARENMPPPFPVPLTRFRETNTFLPRKGAWKGSIYSVSLPQMPIPFISEVGQAQLLSRERWHSGQCSEGRCFQPPQQQRFFQSALMWQ